MKRAKAFEAERDVARAENERLTAAAQRHAAERDAVQSANAQLKAELAVALAAADAPRPVSPTPEPELLDDSDSSASAPKSPGSTPEAPGCADFDASGVQRPPAPSPKPPSLVQSSEAVAPAATPATPPGAPAAEPASPVGGADAVEAPKLGATPPEPQERPRGARRRSQRRKGSRNGSSDAGAASQKRRKREVAAPGAAPPAALDIGDQDVLGGKLPGAEEGDEDAGFASSDDDVVPSSEEEVVFEQPDEDGDAAAPSPEATSEAPSPGLVAPPSAVAAAPEPPQWLRCDGCEKWRKIPADVDTSRLPERWYCKHNHWDAARQSCEPPEEVEADTDRPAAPPSSDTKKRRKWSDSEEERLRQGVEVHGAGNWTKIRDQCGFKGDPATGYEGRSGEDLRVKWRFLKHKKPSEPKKPSESKKSSKKSKKPPAPKKPPKKRKKPSEPKAVREGKWIDEEKTYALALVPAFNKGMLDDCPRGRPLREYLSDKLRCDGMRITKKCDKQSVEKGSALDISLTKEGNSKQPICFKPCDDTSENAEEKERVLAELDGLELLFERAVCGEELDETFLADKNAAIIEKQRARKQKREEKFGPDFEKTAFEEEMTARTDAFAEKQRILRETATPPPTDEGGKPVSKRSLSNKKKIDNAVDRLLARRSQRLARDADGDSAMTDGGDAGPARSEAGDGAAPMDEGLDDASVAPTDDGASMDEDRDDASVAPTDSGDTVMSSDGDTVMGDVSVPGAFACNASCKSACCDEAKFVALYPPQGDTTKLSDGSDPRPLAGMTFLLTGFFPEFGDGLKHEESQARMSKILASWGAKVDMRTTKGAWDVVLCGDGPRGQKKDMANAHGDKAVWTRADVVLCLTKFPEKPTVVEKTLSAWWEACMARAACETTTFMPEGTAVCPDRACNDDKCKLGHRCMGTKGGHPPGAIMPFHWFERDEFHPKSDCRGRSLTCHACLAARRAGYDAVNEKARGATVERQKFWARTLAGIPHLLSDEELEQRYQKQKQKLKDLIAAHRLKRNDPRAWVCLHVYETSTGSQTFVAEGNSSSLTTASAAAYVAMSREDIHFMRMLTGPEATRLGDPPESIFGNISFVDEAKIMERMCQEIGRELREEDGRIRLLYRHLGAGGPQGDGPYDVSARLSPLDGDGEFFLDGPANTRMHPDCYPE